MLLDNDKKIIVLSVPKTGSQSCSLFFKSVLSSNTIYYFPLNVREKHWNVANLIERGLLTHPVSEYNIYAVCRNPIDRYLSAQNYWWKLSTVGVCSGYENFPPEEQKAIRLEYFRGRINNLGLKDYVENDTFYKPQVNWLHHENTLINKVFKYENIDAFVSEVCGIYGASPSTFTTFRDNTSEKIIKIDELDASDITQIELFYHQDKQIYESLDAAT